VVDTCPAGPLLTAGPQGTGRGAADPILAGRRAPTLMIGNQEPPLLADLGQNTVPACGG